jgi:16S rRNA (guanine(966)-N(2))-methyltransferase RsmD
MRVIAGSARGRPLRGPRERLDRQSPIRPTSDLIRGVIFNMLDAMGADYTRVLDLYAGTGALGIEALSRGDGTADFVDDNPDAIALIRANLAATALAERGTIHRGHVSTVVSRLAGPYTLVLADPPYYDVDVFAAPAAVAESPLVQEDTVIVVEHRRGLEPPPTLGLFALYRSRRHGDSVVSIYAQEEGQ